MRRFALLVLSGVLVALGTGVGNAQQVQQYVVSASRWTAAETEAVVAAGGQVVFSHDGAGVAVVTSGAPDFLTRARQSSRLTSVQADRVVRWTPEVSSQIVETAITPGDETFINAQWAPAAIDAPGAWAAGCTGAGVRVAILDGGIHSTHVDLAANLDVARSVSFVPGQAFNNDVGTFWHGTHVAGIVAAADNGIGTIGIAPEARLVGVKVLHNGSGSFGAIIQGILYAATPTAQGGGGADIINMSLGAEFPKDDPDARGLVAAMNKSVNYANRFGVLVVSAAGNSGIDLQHAGNFISVPAESGSGMAVSATGPEGFALGATNFDAPASYTNFGTSAINVSAPGGDARLPGNAICAIPRVPSGSIVNFCWVFDLVLSTARGAAASTTTYAFAAGTSMAAPAVSAVAALVKQKNPSFNGAQLQTAVQNSALSRDPKAFHGKGWVNALRACQY
jgi:subtilisin family serine protease